jgi:hypothetical protein
MAENRASGPHMGQDVIYTETASLFYPAKVITVANTTGLVRLTAFPAGGTTTDKQNVSFDGNGTVSNTWRYPNTISGL